MTAMIRVAVVLLAVAYIYGQTWGLRTNDKPLLAEPAVAAERWTCAESGTQRVCTRRFDGAIAKYDAIPPCIDLITVVPFSNGDYGETTKLIAYCRRRG